MLQMIDLHKSYGKGETSIPNLRNIDFSIENNEFIALMEHCFLNKLSHK